MHSHICVLECADDGELIGVAQGSVDKRGFGGVADAATAGLAVDEHGDGLIKIGIDINVEVAIASAGLDGWHGSTGDHGVDQTCTTARDHHINQTTGGDEVMDGIASLTRKQLDGFARQIEAFHHILKDAYQHLVGIYCGGRTTQ